MSDDERLSRVKQDSSSLKCIAVFLLCQTCGCFLTLFPSRGDDIIPGVIWLYKARDVAEALYKKQSVSSRFERPHGYQSL